MDSVDNIYIKNGVRMIETAALKDKSGEVYTLPRPARHKDVLHQYFKDEYVPREDQGFIDSDLGFVDRKQALKLAKEQGLIIDGKWEWIGLFSEDLW